MNEYHRKKLTNGVRLMVAPLPHLHSVEVVCYVGVGVRHECTEMAGISHFLEHMVFRGNEKYPSGPLIEQAFERIGGSINAATDAEVTSYDSTVHPDSVDDAISLFADLLLNPLFPGLETERSIVLEEAMVDFNEHNDDICLDNRVAKMMWGDHPLGLPVIGFPETIRRFSVADLRRWHKTYYVPNNFVISVAGPVVFDQVAAAVERYFGGWQSAAVPLALMFDPRTCGRVPECCWVRDSGSQVSLQLAWRTDGTRAATSLGLRVLRRILGDGGACRLMQSLREESGLTYSVDVSLEEYPECGCLSIDLATDPEKLVAAVEILLQEMANARQIVPQEELQRVVQMGLYRLYFSHDRVEELAVRYGWGEISGDLRTLHDDTVAWQQISAAAVQEAAMACLRSDRCYFACVGPWREHDKIKVEAMLHNLATRSPTDS